MRGCYQATIISCLLEIKSNYYLSADEVIVRGEAKCKAIKKCMAMIEDLEGCNVRTQKRREEVGNSCKKEK